MMICGSRLLQQLKLAAHHEQWSDRTCLPVKLRDLDLWSSDGVGRWYLIALLVHHESWPRDRAMRCHQYA